MMLNRQHHDVRTTLTLDEDIAAKLRAEAQASGKSFRQVVNEAIRRGLVTRDAVEAAEPFRVEARDLGNLRPGPELDDVPGLLERVEGPEHR